jgi:hypothetical protein
MAFGASIGQPNPRTGGGRRMWGAGSHRWFRADVQDPSFAGNDGREIRSETRARPGVELGQQMESGGHAVVRAVRDKPKAQIDGGVGQGFAAAAVRTYEPGVGQPQPARDTSQSRDRN